MIQIDCKLQQDYPAEIQKFIDKYPEVVDKEVRDVCSEATMGVIRAEPVKTGHLRQKTRLKRIRDFYYQIIADTPYAAHIEFGTKPHRIAARIAKALVFKMGGKTIIVPKNPHKIPGWMLKSGLIGGDKAKSKKDANVIWSQKGYVDHPGTRAYRMMRRQIPFIQEQIPFRIERAIGRMFNAVFNR
jgi:hypothetical protein